jgi:hypothetical protein
MGIHELFHRLEVNNACVQPRKKKQTRKKREEWHQSHGRRATQLPLLRRIYMSSYATTTHESNRMESKSRGDRPFELSEEENIQIGGSGRWISWLGLDGLMC